jgi:putative DNA primase/helicase
MEKKTADDLNTDSKLAAAFAEAFGDRVRYVRESRMFLAWDGSDERWRRSDETAVKAFIRDFVWGLLEHAKTLPREEAFAVAEIAIKAQSKFRRDAIFRLASAERSLWSSLVEFDANPELLHCKNGTVDLRTGKLRPHDPADKITLTTGVDYKPKAKSALLNRVFRHAVPDPDVRAYVGRLAGYSAIGSAREDKLIVLFGASRSGKGSLVEAISAALGDFAAIQKPEFFARQTTTQRHGHTAALIPLLGRRMLSVFETEHGLKLDVAFVKTLCGNDPMSVRALHQAEFRATLHVTPWVMTNTRPEFPHDETGIMERLISVPTGPTIPASKRNPKFREALRTEQRHLEATLAWVVHNAGVYLCEGLGALPQAIAEANEEYRRAMNPVGEFVKECCIGGDDESVAGGELRNAYEIWHRETGFKKWMVPNNQAWTDALEAHGFRKRVTNSIKLWCGVTLKPDTITTGNITYAKLLDVAAAAAPSKTGNSRRGDRGDRGDHSGKLQNKIPYRGYVEPVATVATVATGVNIAKVAAHVVRRRSNGKVKPTPRPMPPPPGMFREDAKAVLHLRRPIRKSEPDRLADRVWKD